MKSICPSEIEDYLFETVDFKDFPNAGIFSTNTLYMSWPGFEPGLLRPQRNVLTSTRSRLSVWILFAF